MRDAFVDTTTALLAEDPRTALVLADISASAFEDAFQRHPDRVFNVGIREQLMAGVAGGLALTGLRPFLHSYTPFLIDRAYEQIKLDFGHQDTGAVLVSIGASFDAAEEGYTHQSPGDVALLDTLDGWTVHVPGHRDEVPSLLRDAARNDERVYVRLSTQENVRSHPTSSVLRRGGPLVVAVGPMLDPVLEATRDMDVTVFYTNTPRPLDTEALRELVTEEIILVEPYAAGTSAHLVGAALSDLPHRALYLGAGRAEVRRYGNWRDHARVQGLDAGGLNRSIADFLGTS
ncbi:transketolase family protein [Actinoplanes derwentensis]|uniref:Transketolase n=1 Tax=Actinoplanes derwentensis TaxID=113562 RepID=A0A1H2CUI6_9ACTN|nr:transketolase [Actinoplanes derwentensis]GID81905.1 transketolase [Actinoplanes derwentensis]SDT74024.1 transketolase [Actinoplanes derwentensis]